MHKAEARKGRNQEWEESGKENPARDDSMYKVQGGEGHSLLEALREGQCGQSILSYDSGSKWW